MDQRQASHKKPAPLRHSNILALSRMATILHREEEEETFLHHP